MDSAQIKRIALECGLKVFGDRIVAADGHISGEATESVIRFAHAIRNQTLEDAAAKLHNMSDRLDVPPTITQAIVAAIGADAIRAMKGE